MKFTQCCILLDFPDHITFYWTNLGKHFHTFEYTWNVEHSIAGSGGYSIQMILQGCAINMDSEISLLVMDDPLHTATFGT